MGSQILYSPRAVILRASAYRRYPISFNSRPGDRHINLLEYVQWPPPILPPSMVPPDPTKLVRVVSTFKCCESGR